MQSMTGLVDYNRLFASINPKIRKIIETCSSNDDDIDYLYN